MSLRSRWSCILWDVDGTIIDASDGILRRLGVAMRHFGHPEVTRAELVHWIGPPMYETFQQQMGMSAAEAEEAVTFYRTLGKQDGYTSGARTYPGIVELIEELADAETPQSTASSKPEIQVAALMDHFGLAHCFSAVVGATDDERALSAKADIVAESLRRLSEMGVDISRPVLVGDRHHDVDGGAEHGVPVIFARWGFSWPHESEGAQAVVDTVEELRDLLLVTDADA